MRASYSWLKDLVDLPAPEVLAERLLHLGLEVSSLEKSGPDFTGVVVGQVLTKDKHPNADRLSVCTVSDGTATYPVVCGAPNVAAGQRVAFAKAGARLPGDFKIKKSKIRGAVSDGMICSTKELGLPADGVDGIMVLPADAPLGRDFAETLGPGDAALEVEVTPNRPDCLSHLGLARELAVHFDRPLKVPDHALPREDGPAPLPVSVADAAGCPRNTGRLVEGVTVGASPDWLKRRLEACGLRPINNAVDVTNYLLLENGQPLHVFDADKLQGGTIEVRPARAGERLEALDGKTYELNPADLVIADAAGPVALAGVIGGRPTGVTESTKRVFIECARFHPGRVRRTARRLGLRTDSSVRFERGLDPAGQAAAARQAAGLLVQLCGGAAGPLSDTAPSTPPRAPVRVTAAEMNSILGTSYPPADVEGVLSRLAAETRRAGDALELTPPSWRLDLERREDLAEEVARHLGYAAIPEEPGPARLPVPAALPVPSLTERLSDALAGLGFQEAFCYDFLSERELERVFGAAGVVDRLDRRVKPADLARLLNPLSEDWAALRPTLLGGLLRAAVLNQNRGAEGGRLFESGRVYAREAQHVSEGTRLCALWWGPWPERAHWRRAAVMPDVHEAHGLAETLLRGRALKVEAGAVGDGLLHPKASATLYCGDRVVGRLGELHPDSLRRWELRGPACALELDVEALAEAPAPALRHAPVSALRAPVRDLSLDVPEAVAYGELAAALAAVPALERVELVDVYTGERVAAGQKAWTLRLTLKVGAESPTEAEIGAVVAQAVSAAESRGAKLRA